MFATDPDGTASRILAVVLPPYFHTARQAVTTNNDPLAVVKEINISTLAVAQKIIGFAWDHKKLYFIKEIEVRFIK